MTFLNTIQNFKERRKKGKGKEGIITGKRKVETVKIERIERCKIYTPDASESKC